MSYSRQQRNVEKAAAITTVSIAVGTRERMVWLMESMKHSQKNGTQNIEYKIIWRTVSLYWIENYRGIACNVMNIDSKYIYHWQQEV